MAHNIAYINMHGMHGHISVPFSFKKIVRMIHISIF